ncbi:J domain-containing protein [Zoogloea sp.]|uniref:J domain-containing protein n=1 Tax=Zoogloea sp. TaxID=49181 RepID=UPI0035B0DFA2
MKTRTTLYDLLGLTPTASEADIHAAHMRLVRHYQSGTHGLDPADADNRIKAIKEAWWILSEPGRRAAYDASLVPTQPEPPPGLDVPAGVLPVDMPPRRAFKPRSPLRTMLNVIGGLLAVGVGVQILMSAFAVRQMAQIDNGEAMSAAQSRAAAAERRQMYGDLTDEEIARQATEERRRREAYQQAEADRRAEYERREAERRHEMALAERKQYADQVSNELRRAEEEARRRAEWERQQKEAREREEEAREQMRLEQRLARERARLGVSSSSGY